MASPNIYNLATDNGRYVSIPGEDIQIQEGRMYKINEKKVDLASGSTYNIHIKTSANFFSFIQQIRMNFGDGPLDVVIRENPSVTDGSTTVPTRNLNRNSTDTSEVTIYNNSSSISGGTVIDRIFIPSGKDQAFILEDGRWVVKKDADYVVQIVNNSGQLLTFSYNIVYHEHN